MLITYLSVMMGGAAGVGARMALSEWITRVHGGPFPAGTFAVNVAGCFLIGLFTGLTGPGGLIEAPPLVRQVVMAGFLGGFTTYSSFSIQTLDLFASGHTAHAAANIVLTLLLCLASTAAGLAIARLALPAPL